MYKGLFLLNADAYPKIYGPQQRAQIEQLAHIYAPPQTGCTVQENPAVLHGVEVIFAGWGMPRMDEAFLAADGLRASAAF
jgi:hypothetical protein